jgi:single-strand DNA-binding protein
MLNRVILIGRLTKDPELKYTPNGTAVASFTLAVNRFRSNAQGEQEADFIPIVVWQKQAENCANYLNKGSLAAVDGRLQVRTFDGKDGNRRWVTEVVAENVRFLDQKGENKGSDQGGLGGDSDFSDEDIPF